jgi:hypothetical protein
MRLSMSWMCKKWKEGRDRNSSIPFFEEWVQGIAKRDALDVTKPEDLDRLLLSYKPAQRAMRYTKIKAFGNHFEVDDATSAELQTYDSGIASVFEVPITNATKVSVNYLEVLKDILKLDYGPLYTPVIILRGEWMKRQDNQGNPTYTKDDAGFLIVNFRHKLPRMEEPFVFSS